MTNLLPSPERVAYATAFAGLVIVGLYVPRIVTSSHHVGLLVNGLVLAVAAVGLGFLMHQCGLVMFGVAAFVGLPPYLVGYASGALGWTALPAALFAIVGTTAFALAVGALIVRARPLPFSMLTLALAQMVKTVVGLQALRPITAGDDGMSFALNGTFLGLTQAELARPTSFWPVAWLGLSAAMLIAWVAARSRFGEILRATQINEERMRFSGFDTYWPRVAAFTICCFILSLAGTLAALHTTFASPEILDFAASSNSLVAMLIGGASTVTGPVLGALLFTWGQDVFGATGHLELLTGLSVVFVIAAFPQGAMGFLIRLKRAVLASANRRFGKIHAAR